MGQILTPSRKLSHTSLSMYQKMQMFIVWTKSCSSNLGKVPVKLMGVITSGFGCRGKPYPFLHGTVGHLAEE